MTPQQKQLIRKEWKDAVETANAFTDYIKMSGSRTLNADAIADWWLDRYEPITKETERVTEERIGKEIVICSAIRMNDGYIVRGHRHADAIRTASQIPRYKNDLPFGSNQGFVTSKGRYVDRIEGAKIQKLAGIKSKMPEGQEYLHGELYSEDLY